jgi:hypothetical protein
MKKINIAIAFAALTFAACNTNSKTVEAVPFCKDSSCITEPLIVRSDAPGKPFVRISFKDCKIDSIHTEKTGKGVIKDVVFREFIPNEITPSKEAIGIDIIDAKYACIRLND